ncbi:hypothetical protein C8R45DRAFT_1216454 [Mycena sanguinolenta]|nr:hypothetical protein C8R45DRAFT_1216454 [Mycena sanguinolenta]
MSSWDSYILAGWDIAICLTLFLQGVLCAQFARYLTLGKRDSIWLKVFVAGLALMTTLRSSQCLAIMWIQNVTLFGNIPAASQMWEKHWVSKLDLILEGTGTFYVQMFFCRRLWAISRKAPIVIICCILFTFGLVSAVIGTFFMFKNSTPTAQIIGWVSMHLGAMLCGDLLLTGSTVFYLLRHSNAAVFPRSPFAMVINSLLWVTVQPAAPAAICALINFIVAVQIYTESWIPELLMVDFITNVILSQLYAWAALWTLNSRENILFAAENCSYSINVATSVPQITTALDLGTIRNLEPWRHIPKPHLVV